jgi:hypothetical protein
MLNYELAPQARPAGLQFIIHNSLIKLIFVNYLVAFFLPATVLRLPLRVREVVLGALTTNGQTFTVTQTTVATDVHEPFDVELHFEQHTLDLILGAITLNFAGFLSVQFTFLFRSTPAFERIFLGRVRPMPKMLRQRDFAAFVVWDVYLQYEPCGEFGLLAS